MKLNDWVLLKAIFNSRLHDAVMEKNEEGIHQLIDEEYSYEKDNGFFEVEPLELDKLQKEHNKNISNEELIIRLL
ncbi:MULTISPECIES: hypothetical protein [unclassified Paenibacillus]|uniref:Uncharacterized protein n=1 Tax=Paenibacillus provencensis TaxID=441151 RepID=A0ABW3PWF9_9BACL|nr:MULTISPECIES: hypothetical protein [unclassified Paenibacillus]MCM3130235.1 hypothetical protein [Paenibacillus sp. MER 78]SDX72249.1 hypothetical protein SAMN05518848_112126 [Paenibacillus sp. PDC88]SFS89213.1 hypothetical protein SAMN04488601_106122 [Paenibacillus sp. 453mf]